MKRTVATWALAVAGLFAISLVAAPTGVSAQSKKKVDEKLKLYEKKLEELSEKDEWGATGKDRKLAESSLEKARELLAQGSVEKAGWLVTRAGDRIDLVRALLDVRRIQAGAEQQEEKFREHKENTIPDLEKEIKKLKKRKRELEDKLSNLE